MKIAGECRRAASCAKSASGSVSAERAVAHREHAQPLLLRQRAAAHAECVEEGRKQLALIDPIIAIGHVRRAEEELRRRARCRVGRLGNSCESTPLGDKIAPSCVELADAEDACAEQVGRAAAQRAQHRENLAKLHVDGRRQAKPARRFCVACKVEYRAECAAGFGHQPQLADTELPVLARKHGKRVAPRQPPQQRARHPAHAESAQAQVHAAWPVEERRRRRERGRSHRARKEHAPRERQQKATADPFEQLRERAQPLCVEPRRGLTRTKGDPSHTVCLRFVAVLSLQPADL
eukprot:5348667-Pleurochrysis_carterae.AAC.3